MKEKSIWIKNVLNKFVKFRNGDRILPFLAILGPPFRELIQEFSYFQQKS